MSNQPTIQPTKFENTRTGQILYGVRVYDNYCHTYHTELDWESTPDDDMEILKYCIDVACEDNEVARGFFDSVEEMESGVFVGNTWYDWDEIKHLFEEVKNE